MSITIGLDLGTINTKICIENIDRNETNYSFLRFDHEGGKEYLLPSEMFIDSRGKILYGFVPSSGNGRYIQNFKQRIFTNLTASEEDKYCCIWFIANIIFDLEVLYSKEFTIQMGVPADISTLAKKKELAKTIVASAYYLVEEIFHNDKKAFLNSTEQELKKCTKIIDDSEIINGYGTLVFPEAYAYLLMFTRRDSISKGMSLIVDLGGSTTDISFFNISTIGKMGCDPTICDFRSLNVGTNLLYRQQETSAIEKSEEIVKMSLLQKLASIGFVRKDSKQKNKTYRAALSDKINEKSLENYKSMFNEACQKLIIDIQNNFLKNNPGTPVARLWEALQNRPIIYAGGGSMNERFRVSYSFAGNRQSCFSQAILISDRDWEVKHFKKDLLDELKSRNLIPLLSTAYGLSHSTENMSDDINVTTISGLFQNGTVNHNSSNDSSFSYGLDYDAFK